MYPYLKTRELEQAKLSEDLKNLIRLKNIEFEENSLTFDERRMILAEREKAVMEVMKKRLAEEKGLGKRKNGKV